MRLFFYKSRLTKTNFFRYKFEVADAVVAHLNPIRLKIEDYMQNPEYLVSVLRQGSEKASEIAETTLDEVKRKMGLGINLQIANSLKENLKM